MGVDTRPQQDQLPAAGLQGDILRRPTQEPTSRGQSLRWVRQTALHSQGPRHRGAEMEQGSPARGEWLGSVPVPAAAARPAGVSGRPALPAQLLCVSGAQVID